ncbi:hypothetical protein J4E89_008658 [Alternaria sp. Ai002NY15]|nr:hypothetical protein J4E89_008658 [Alternaria sp. Ai002NY15]
MSGFTFGGAANNSGGSNTPQKSLFGAAPSTGSATPSLFGTANNTSSTPASSGGGGLFGGGAASSGGSGGLFGGASNTPASKPGGGLFGGGSATPAPSSTPGFGGGFGFGQKKEGDAPKPAGGLFGGASTGAAPASSGSPFGGFGGAGSSTPTATPAANKTSFLPSTTPAGAPPGGSLFGQNNQSSGGTSSLFGQKPAATSASSTPGLFGAASGQSAAKPSGGFSLGGNTGASGDANKPAAPASTPSGGLFGGGPSAPASQDAQASKPAGGLFGGLGSSTPSSTPAKPLGGFSLGTSSAAPASTQPTATSGLSLGGNNAASSGSAAPSLFSPAGASTPASTGGGFSFPKPAAPASTAATTGATTTATSGAPTTTASSNTSLFPSLGSGLGGGNTTSAASGAATTTTSGATPSLFSKPAGSEAPAASSNTTSQPTPAPGATSGNNAGQSGLAASTAGPAPSAQSRLKNKSMDEIITRWAADLSKYQKEFQSQAETVASWDRALVENSDKVRQLYSKTFQAERDAAEVERQLTMMEENQQELDSYLDRYEKEIDNLMKMHGVSGKNETLRGPDQERERTYKLAEKLQDRLNELNKDLTEMIEEINNTSQTLSKTGKPDDPLTKVVRVLNTQLAQLQLIDSGASQLQEKINKAQREGQRVGANGWNGLGSDPSADFMNSMRGGRASQRFGGVS